MRLVHQLSLTLLATTLAAVAAMGGFMALNLRAGFSDYLRAQDQQRLTAFAGAARAAIEAHGIEGIAARPRLLRPPGLEGEAPPEGRDPPDGPPPGREFRPPRGEGFERPPRFDPEQPPRPGPEQQMARRGLSLLDPQGRLIWGREPPPGRTPLEESVRLRGEVVATARLVPRPEAPEALDLGFLRRQLFGIVVIGGSVALIAAALAALLARRWLRPLTEVQRASHRLAQGDFAIRLPRRAARQRNEFDALVDDVNHLAAALENLESSRRRWIAELSHELRTPLTVLRGELDAVRDGVRPLNAERIEALSREVQRLRRLADDFHHLALADLRALPCQPRALDPAELLRQLAQRHQANAGAAGLTLDSRLDALPALVHWDGERITQVLDNLIGNAIAYTDPPGRIQLSARAAGAQIELRVDDSPPGVSPALLPRLFDPLFRADTARQRRDGQGSGLGLSIARAWVLRHGGSISAEPSPLGGLGLVIRLPLQAPP